MRNITKKILIDPPLALCRAQKPDRYWFAPQGTKTPGSQPPEGATSGGLKLDIPPGSRMKYAAGCTGSTLRPGVSCKLSWSLWALPRRPPCKFDNWRDWRPDAAAQVTARAASAVLRAVFSPKTRAASGRWIVRNFREPGAPVHRHGRARRGSSAHRAVQDRVHYPVAGTGRSCRTDSGSGRRAGHLAKISAGEDTAGGSVQT